MTAGRMIDVHLDRSAPNCRCLFQPPAQIALLIQLTDHAGDWAWRQHMLFRARVSNLVARHAQVKVKAGLAMQYLDNVIHASRWRCSVPCHTDVAPFAMQRQQSQPRHVLQPLRHESTEILEMSIKL